MRAIAFTPQVPRSVRMVERPEPGAAAAGEIKLQVLQVGICGTDREEAAGMRADAPPGRSELVLGHEMFGKVVEAGSGVRSVVPGDYAAFTVRRGCSHCGSCRASRSDMCESGDYLERGIKALDGYQTELVVDSEQYLVRVPEEVKSVGVLCEPLSIVEKAIDEAITLQAARLPYISDRSEWLGDAQVLVAGLGPVGLLAVLVCRLRGARVVGLDIVEPDSPRVELLRRLGGTYVDDRQVTASSPVNFGPFDLIFEATGVAPLEFDLFSALAINGVYVVTGIPGGSRSFNVDGATLMRQFVLRNQLLIGSVNASRKHFETAVADLRQGVKTWRPALEAMITHRFAPEQFEDALLRHDPGEIKAVIEWAQ